jgi:hypothetical protein
MGNYLFERNTDDGAGDEAGSSLSDDVSRALNEFDWIDQFAVKADDGDGSVVVAEVHFDPDWPDTANPDLVAEVLHRFGLRLIDNPAQPGGKVSAADPLRVGATAGDDALDLVICDD